MKFKFGDIVMNGHAGNNNPEKIGIYITSKQNGNPVFTDGRGSTWEIAKHDKFLKISNCLDMAVYNKAIKTFQNEHYDSLMQLVDEDEN